MPRRLLLTACFLAGLVGCGNAPASHREGANRPARTEAGVGRPVGVVGQSELYGPATLAEVAGLSTAVVEGTVKRVEKGPTVGDEGSEIGLLRATVDVEKAYQGPEREQIELLFTGYRPDNGDILTVEDSLPVEPGTHGIWFVRPAEIDEAPGAFYVSTSAGEIQQTDDGTAVTGGDLEASAVACRKGWPEVQEMVRLAVSEGADAAPLEAGADSPHADPAFEGNPCTDLSHADDEDDGVSRKGN